MDNVKFDTFAVLMMRYQYKSMIPLEDVARDYLPSCNKTELHRKAKKGKFEFAIVNTGTDNRPAYFVPLLSLAAWIDTKTKEAIDDHYAMHA